MPSKISCNECRLLVFKYLKNISKQKYYKIDRYFFKEVGKKLKTTVDENAIYLTIYLSIFINLSIQSIYLSIFFLQVLKANLGKKLKTTVECNAIYLSYLSIYLYLSYKSILSIYLSI